MAKNLKFQNDDKEKCNIGHSLQLIVKWCINSSGIRPKYLEIV